MLVLNFKNIFKYIRFFILLAITLILLFFIYRKSTINIDYIAHNIDTEFDSIYVSILNENIPAMKIFFKSYTDYPFNPVQTILYSELPILNTSFYTAPAIVENTEETQNSNNETITYASDNVPTKVIENNVPTNYTNEYNGVEIKNGTDYELTDDILNPSSLSINTNDIIIFHTHTCESYTQSENYTYEESGNFRTVDLTRSVCRVGDELSKYMTSYGYNVIHDTTYHDYPSYTGSYGRSMATVENLLVSAPNTDVIIDVHRDAIADTSYAPSVIIGDEIVSQLMFVIGTDGGGLEHPNWQNNLKFAIKVQSKANELYPGLFKPIVLRNSRYNQQLGNAACIIEVGATGNTLDQSILSMKYLSRVLSEILKQ